MSEFAVQRDSFRNIFFIEPQSYLDMVRLLEGSRLVLTDSGGLQKEAYILQKPCVTLRDTTEWVETVEEGWNILAGPQYEEIIRCAEKLDGYSGKHCLRYGRGNASEEIEKILKSFLLK